MASPKSDPSSAVKLYVNWRDAFPHEERPTLEWIKGEFGQFNAEDLLQSLGKMGWIVEECLQQNRPLPLPWFKGLFDLATQQRLSPVLQSGVHLLARHLVSFAQKLAIIHGSAEGGLKVEGNGVKLGRLLMACSDYSEGSKIVEIAGQSVGTPERRKRALAALARSIYCNSIPRLNHQFGRSWAMLNKYPGCVKNRYPNIGLNFEDKIEEASGFKPLPFMAYSMGLASQYLGRLTADVMNDPGAFGIGSQYWAQVLPERRLDGKRFFVMVSRNLKEFREMREILDSSLDAGGYDWRYSLAAPLFRFANGSGFVLDVRALSELGTERIFWLLHDFFRDRDKGTLDQIQSFRGRIFEEHIRYVLSAAYPAKGLLKRIYFEKEDGFDGVDFVLDDGEVLVFIEATVSQIPVTRLLGGDWDSVEKSIDRILFGDGGKALQLGKAIADFESGKLRIKGVDRGRVRRILPVMLVERGIPQFPPITREMRARIEQKTVMGRWSSDFECMDIEELEISTGAFPGMLSKGLIGKLSGGYSEYPFKNYIHSVKAELAVPSMDALYETAMDEVMLYLFGKTTDDLSKAQG